MRFEKDITACIKILQRGGIILYPSDTVWGLGCDATSKEAVEKIFSVKKRKKEKSFIILVSDQTMLAKYVKEVSEKARRLIKTETQPLTIIYENVMNLPENIMAKDGSVGIRIPKDAFCLKLIEQFGKPIVSTSANVSGENIPANFLEISIEIKTQADYTVKYKQDETTQKKPSSVVKILPDGEIITLRK